MDDLRSWCSPLERCNRRPRRHERQHGNQRGSRGTRRVDQLGHRWSLPGTGLPAAPTDGRISALADLEAYINNGARVPSRSPASCLPTSDGDSGPGHNGWMMTSTALVLMMTLPGLALFYGGLVRRKNILSVCAQCFGITGLVAILWWLCGYGLVFGVNHGAYCDPKTGALTASPLGDLQYACFGFTPLNKTYTGDPAAPARVTRARTAATATGSARTSMRCSS